jgi:hypothetical protein
MSKVRSRERGVGEVIETMGAVTWSTCVQCTPRHANRLRPEPRMRYALSELRRRASDSRTG